ncbi:MAG: anti-sigma regulatory factor [Nitrospiraceae bacterium]|nr:anti-sigma regulatory factor [Nitrospiraceae bacterium]
MSTTRVPINSSADILAARQMGRSLARQVGFSSPTDLTLIATAISELARNIVHYAKQGEVVLDIVRHNGKCGIAIVAKDEGPGIANISQVMQAGYSTSGGLGLGLPGVQRLMDEFEIVSNIGKGTTVTAIKWVLQHE